MCKEGIFRKAGNRQRMRTLRGALNEAGPGLVIDTSVYNAHDVCGVFKEFLRELPEPLLTERHMEAHMQIAGKHYSVVFRFDIGSFSFIYGCLLRIRSVS